MLGHLLVVAFHDLDVDGLHDDKEPYISGVAITIGERSCRSDDAGICDLGQLVFGEHQSSARADGFHWVISPGGSIRKATEVFPLTVDEKNQRLLLPLAEEVFRLNGVVVPRDYIIAIWPFEKASYLYTSTDIDEFGISGQAEYSKNASEVDNQRIICMRAGLNPSHLGTDVFTPGNEYSALVSSMFDASLIAAGRRPDGTTIVVYRGTLEHFSPEEKLKTYEIAVSMEHLSSIELAENLLIGGGGENSTNGRVYDIDYTGVTGDVSVPRGTPLGVSGNSEPTELGGSSGCPHTHFSGYLIVDGRMRRKGIIEFEDELPLTFLGEDTIVKHIVKCWPTGSDCCK